MVDGGIMEVKLGRLGDGIKVFTDTREISLSFENLAKDETVL